MIRSVADLLNELLRAEADKLASLGISHGPTIGSMYEGLAREALGRAIPSELDLRVVSGFATDSAGQLTAQQDIMVVRGSGSPIPHTDSFVWPIQDVLAVVEVKKTLYSKQLLDAFENLRSVGKCYRRFIELAAQRGNDVVVSGRMVRRVFAQMTGVVAPPIDDLGSLPHELEVLFRVLVSDYLSPVKIVFGYDGFKSEAGFREALYRMLSQRLRVAGFGVQSFPQVLVSGSFSLFKTNGLPYFVRLRDGWWPFLLSSSENPLIFVLEYLWTRIEREVVVDGLWGDDQQQETANPFLSGRPIRAGDAEGWEYRMHDLSQQELAADSLRVDWQPTELDQLEFTVVNMLCNGRDVSVTDSDLAKFAADSGRTAEELVRRLQSTGLVALEGNRLNLTTEECGCAILPDGRLIAGENARGTLMRWVAKASPTFRRSAP